MLTMTHTDATGRELTVEIDYAFVVPVAHAAPYAEPSIESVTVVAIDGRSILGPKEDGYGSREMAYESERFEKAIEEDPVLLDRIHGLIVDHEADRRLASDGERGV